MGNQERPWFDSTIAYRRLYRGLKSHTSSAYASPTTLSPHGGFVYLHTMLPYLINGFLLSVLLSFLLKEWADYFSIYGHGRTARIATFIRDNW